MQNAECKMQNEERGDTRPFDLAFALKEFALRIVRLYSLCRIPARAKVLGKQILRVAPQWGLNIEKPDEPI